MKKSHEITLKEAIDKYIDALKFREKFDVHKLEARWESLVGKKLHENTQSLELKEGKLYVKMKNAVARQELSFIRSRIILAINKHLKKEAVKEIIVL